MSDLPSLFDPSVVECPYDAYRIFREQSPVTEIGPSMFLVSRYDDVIDILRDPETFSSRSPTNPFALFGPSPVQGEIDEILGDFREIPTLLNNDPPDQTRVRSLVSRAFTPRQVKTLVPKIRTIVDETFSTWAHRGRVDFATEFARPLPSAVTAELLGAPPAMRERMTFWADEIMSRTTGPQIEERQLEVARNIAKMAAAFLELVEARRSEPRDDLLSLLVKPELDGDGEVLSDAQIVNVAETFLVGGNETTTFLLTSAMHVLAKRPMLAEDLRESPGGIPAFVEEMLRLEAPSQGLPRWTTRDVDVREVRIPRGSTVLVMFAAANRDGAAFAAPDELVLDATAGQQVRHLAFGHGTHFCLGAPLARTEMRVALETLLPRMREIDLDPAGPLQRSDNPLLRGFRRLGLTFTPFTAATSERGQSRSSAAGN